MDANENGKKSTKLRVIIKRQLQMIEVDGSDSPELDFVYDDADSHANEIAELYSYTEHPELPLNVKAFEDQMEAYGHPPSWQRLSLEKRRSVVMKLLDQLEHCSRDQRMKAARCILYLAQGCWAEMQSDTEQQEWERNNVFLLYESGAFSAFVQLLNIEIENVSVAHVAMRKIAFSLSDSEDLRVILSVMYTIVEVFRHEKACGEAEHEHLIITFVNELNTPYEDELLAAKLLRMVIRFCGGISPHFPMKKVLLLLWKVLLVSLGGIETLRNIKEERRKLAGLSVDVEDTLEVSRKMRASSPPASATDLIETQNSQKKATRPIRRSLMKQSSLDDHESLSMDIESAGDGCDLAEIEAFADQSPADGPADDQQQMMLQQQQQQPPGTPVTSAPEPVEVKSLPWKTKVRQKDIDAFLENSRLKFVGYSLQGDRDSLAGLPQPIHEGMRILKQHMYVSLSEIQIQKEEDIARNPMSCRDEQIQLIPAEVLYQAILPNVPQYTISLLKILLAAGPTSKTKTESINIIADVLPEDMPLTALQSMKLGIDVNRHKEIIVKAVSAILLLLLKHFKVNHVYQFEFMSQHLVFANCIPLVIKFFNQSSIMSYVGAKNIIPILDFPACVIGDQPELTNESLEIGDAAPYSWRNIFSCINLLRILNKLTKWKHSRIMMLVVFKSAPILKKTLKVRHAMTQLYVLKLLKMQTKYLGRQWRKSNMKTISAIYSKVRHRLNDDWAYGSDLDARPWDFQAEECALRTCVDRFNNRRYTNTTRDSDYEPVDNCLSSVLGNGVELSNEFKRNYEIWLQQEVFAANINWDVLLGN